MYGLYALHASELGWYRLKFVVVAGVGVGGSVAVVGGSVAVVGAAAIGAGVIIVVIVVIVLCRFITLSPIPTASSHSALLMSCSLLTERDSPFRSLTPSLPTIFQRLQDRITHWQHSRAGSGGALLLRRSRNQPLQL